MGFGTIGTVRQDLSSPASARYFGSSANNVGVPSQGAEPLGEIGAPVVIMAPSDWHASVKNAPQASIISGCPTATCGSPPVLDMALAAQGAREAARIIRAARLRDLLAAVEEWRRASGPDRVWWRGHASWLIGQWRCLHQAPERAAFQRAVARSQAARP